jgi:hypothetical protein
MRDRSSITHFRRDCRHCTASVGPLWTAPAVTCFSVAEQDRWVCARLCRCAARRRSLASGSFPDDDAAAHDGVQSVCVCLQYVCMCVCLHKHVAILGHAAKHLEPQHCAPCETASLRDRSEGVPLRPRPPWLRPPSPPLWEQCFLWEVRKRLLLHALKDPRARIFATACIIVRACDKGIDGHCSLVSYVFSSSACNKCTHGQ